MSHSHYAGDLLCGKAGGGPATRQGERLPTSGQRHAAATKGGASAGPALLFRAL